MFSVETALIKSTLLEWLKKNKFQQLGLDLLIKNKCERKNQINWQEGKSVKLRQDTTTCQILKYLTVTFLLDLNINFSEIYIYMKKFSSHHKFAHLKNIVKHIKNL